MVIMGNPVAKASVRLGRYGAYIPTKSRKYMDLLAKEALMFKGFVMRAGVFESEVEVDAIFHLKIPKSMSKKLLASGIRPKKKPDLDNLEKSWDGFKGILWKDDSQIVSKKSTKVYSDKPRLEITISYKGASIDNNESTEASNSTTNSRSRDVSETMSER